MRTSRMTLLVLAAWIGMAAGLEAFEARRAYAGQSNYVVNFDEGDVKSILAKRGITNRYGYYFTRDSSGAALFVALRSVNGGHESTLIITETEIRITDHPVGVGLVGYFDSLKPAWYYQEEYGSRWCVFADGGRLLTAQKRGEPRRFYLRSAPGNRILSLTYRTEPFSRIISIDRRDVPMFTKPRTNIVISGMFCKNDKVILIGEVGGSGKERQWRCWTFQEKGGKWEQQGDVLLPDADYVTDLDPESPHVLCYQARLFGQRSFVFNTESMELSNAYIKIWRQHGFFLREGVVKQVQAALKDK